MATDKCQNCAESIESGYSVCWRCGTHADGTPPSAEFIPDSAPPLPADVPQRKLSCLRCEQSMVLVRRMKFHEGTRAWAFLFGELGELLVNRESFDSYACTKCGKVEFFVAGSTG